MGDVYLGGLPVLRRVDRIAYDEARDDLLTQYETTGERKFGEARRGLAHLTPFFAGWRLAGISGADVTTDAAQRQAAKAAASTINRELGVLGKMLRVADRNNKLMPVPAYSLLKEAPLREGFFEQEQYEAVRRHLPDDLKVVMTIAHTVGWRVPSEILTLERRQLDLEAGTLRLDPGTTKNRDGRLVYLTPELKAMLAAQVERVRALERRLGRIIRGSSRTSPRTAGAWAGEGRGCRRRGRPPLSGQGWPGVSRTTSGGRRCGTSSAGASRGRSR